MKAHLSATLALFFVANCFLTSPATFAQDFQAGKRIGRAAKADLTIQNFQQVGKPKYKNGKLEVPFRMTVKNIGSANSKDNLVNGIRISNEYQWSGFMASIPANGSKVIEGVLKATVPAQAKPNQDLHLIAMVDAPIAGGDTSMPSWGRERESNESNNTKALGVRVPSPIGSLTTTSAKPTTRPAGSRPGKIKGRRPNSRGATGPADLTVVKFEQQGQARYSNGNLEIPFRMQIRNLGGVRSPDNVINGVSFGNEYRWSGLMKSVAANGTTVATGVVKIPDPGKLKQGRKLKLVAMTDAPIAAADTSIPKWGRVQESNETNNQRILNVKVPGGLDLTSGSGNQGTQTSKPARKKKFGRK